jgi:DNA-binding CsgD family transcriptional regulator
MLQSGEIKRILASSVRTGRKNAEPQHRLALDEVRRLVEGYKSGATVYELAEQFGLNRETVSSQLKQSGVVLRNVIRDDEVVRAIELFESGLSANLIGKRLGRDPKTIRTMLATRTRKS